MGPCTEYTAQRRLTQLKVQVIHLAVYIPYGVSVLPAGLCHVRTYFSQDVGLCSSSAGTAPA